jgi:hypothetical protein
MVVGAVVAMTFVPFKRLIDASRTAQQELSAIAQGTGQSGSEPVPFVSIAMTAKGDAPWLK